MNISSNMYIIFRYRYTNHISVHYLPLNGNINVFIHNIDTLLCNNLYIILWYCTPNRIIQFVHAPKNTMESK